MSRLRLDHFLTVHLFRHISAREGGSRIPILMYHSISDEPEKSHPYYSVNTSPAVFRLHMQLLHHNNYRVINLNEIKNALVGAPFDKYVVITFDDGFRDFYTDAYPILKKYGFKATVFLPTAFITEKRSSFKKKECMNWDEVKGLSQNGIIFGSHTVSHPKLVNLSIKEIEKELKLSKDIIENKIDTKIDSFCYPFAFPENRLFQNNLKNILIECGYINGVCTKIGRVDSKTNMYFCPRLPINTYDDTVFFKAKLQGKYDWMRFPQNYFKRLKHYQIIAKDKR